MKKVRGIVGGKPKACGKLSGGSVCKDPIHTLACHILLQTAVESKKLKISAQVQSRGK